MVILRLVYSWTSPIHRESGLMDVDMNEGGVDPGFDINGVDFAKTSCLIY